MSQEKNIQTGIVIPPNRLDPQSLANLIDEFILREGTDYGKNEIELSTKRQQLLNQIENQNLLILFDPNQESTTLINKKDLEALKSEQFQIIGADL